MKKLIFIFIVIGVNAAGILLLLPESPFNVKKQTIYIALAGPMSGADKENGEDMLRGAKMCLDQIKANGRFKDKKIELLIYNDKDKRTAIKIASQIADEAKALLVIGHYGSDSSIAAGTVYRKNGIPAITASATSEAVTNDNDWYFRIVPDNRFITDFIAYSVRNLLGSTSASIIYDQNAYGTSLAQGFEAEAGKLGIKIKNKWAFDSGSDNMAHELRNIVGDLRAAKKPGTIFCASGASEAVRLFASSRYPGTDYTVVGPTSFSTHAFISQFNEYPREQKSPGYYTDGIFAMSPFISYLADKEDARSFREKFVSKYGKEPSWVAACYYDAMQVALCAVERAEIRGQIIREDRRRVRKALTGFNEHDVAIQGITGDIYFDKQGDITRPLAIGVWQNHKFIPTYAQFQGTEPVLTPNEKIEPKGETSQLPIADNKETEEKTIEIRGQVMTYLRVVFAGVDVNEVRNIDTEKGAFTADFYLWFRFNGKFDDTHIRFANAVNPVTLGKPMAEEISGDITTRAYRVIADFKTDYDTDTYPLDRHTLHISFQHTDLTRKELIYVPDVEGLPHTAEKEDKGKMMVKPIPGWDTLDISFSQNIIKMPGPDKKTISYSEFNTDIRIQREGRILLMLKIIFPMIMILAVLYFVFLMPYDLPGNRMLIFSFVVPIIAGIRLWYGYMLPGQEIVKHMFLLIYVLTGFSVLISGVSHIMYKRYPAEKVRYLSGLRKILYLILALAGSVFLVYSYWPLFVS